MVISGGGMNVESHQRPLILADNESIYFGAGSNSCIYYDGTDTFWDLQNVGSGALMIALTSSFPSPDGVAVHIWKGTAGAVTANANRQLIIENSDFAGITILTPNDKAGFLDFGDTNSPSAGRLAYTHSGTPRFEFTIEDMARLSYSAGAFAFQEATIISTTAGDLTWNPTDDVQMGADVFIEHDTNATLTAGTTQTQANGLALTTEINEIAVVANPNDTVVLPEAAAGRRVAIINNGANTLRMYPKLNDDLGGGVDVFRELEPNEVIDFIAYDAVNWHVESSTETAHAEMFDTENSDAYIINAQTDDHMYHTNGLGAGDLAGWTFDAGGAGTSFPVASIADSPGSSGSQAEITTTGSHGLAAGDIVSLSDMSAGSNAGVHVVLAPIVATKFEIASANSTNATGTMDQAATLICNAGAEGQYKIHWSASAIAVTNNDIFVFAIHVEAAHQSKTNIERKFGIAADIGAMSGGAFINVGSGEHVSFMVRNTAGAGNITIKDLNVNIERL